MTGLRSLPIPTLDLYEVAHLAGGPARVTDTAVVALLERGLLGADADGRLQAVGPSAGHPVEAAVLDAVGPRARRSAASLHWRLADDPRIVAVGERLAGEGLLRRNPVARLRAGWPRLLRTGAGRQLLEQWQTAPPSGVGSPGALRVALSGPPALADLERRTAVFGADDPRPAPRRGSNRPWHVQDHARAVSSSAYGGAAFAGGDVGGAGWGGGDGGCGGGDGGGGGC